jgi:hypothetical protein
MHCHVSRHVTVNIELRDGQVLNWEDFLGCYSQLDQTSDVNYYIRLTAWATPLELLGDSDGRVVARIVLADGSVMHWSFASTTNEPLPVHRSYYGVWLWLGHDRWVSGSDNTKPSMLVVVESGGTAERVGVGGIWESSCKITFFGVDGVTKLSMTGPSLNDFWKPKPHIMTFMAGKYWVDGPDQFPKTRRTFHLG